MNTTVSGSDFIQAFDDMGRGNNFSYEGRQALYAYLESYEQEMDEEMELDVIAICCDFTEYENLEEFQAEYSDEYETIDAINDATTVIPINDESFIIQAF